MGKNSQISILTLNVNGLLGNAHRSAIFTYFLLKAYDIVLLQETHVHDAKTVSLFKREWPGRSFFTIGTTPTSGCAILLRDGLQCHADCVKYGADSLSLVFI